MRTPNNESVGLHITDAPQPNKRANERTCILTGEASLREKLLRLAISPEGDVLPDPAAKAPGRGAWIGVDREALELAIAKGHLKGAMARSFKSGGVSIPADLPDQIESALSKSLTQRLGLEHRAGNIVLGTAKIAEQARTGRVELLLHAQDASEDGRKKLDQAWRVGKELEGSGARGIVLPLDRTALSVALGRENTVHMALNTKGSATRIEHALARWLQFSKAGHSNPQGANRQSADRHKYASPIATASGQ